MTDGPFPYRVEQDEHAVWRCGTMSEAATVERPAPWHNGGESAMRSHPICSIPTCQSPDYSRGWCIKHYARWRRHGDPLMVVFAMPEVRGVCGVLECSAPHASKGYCRAHSARLRRYGDPLAARPRVSKPAADRFFTKIEKTATCWNWLGASDTYGHFMSGSSRQAPHIIGAHQFSYELHKGPIPDGLVIDHLCRNTLCVNPDHLEAVTQRENVHRGLRCVHP